MADLFNEPDPAAARLIRVIDYETTGTPEDEMAEVIEFGRIDLDLDTYTLNNPFQALARPARPIPPITRAVHHISDADVADCPNPGTLWQAFWDGCGPNDVVAAHNARFEQHFHGGNGRRWICTYKCARVVWPDAPGHSNQALRYWLGVDEHPEHFVDPFDPAQADPPHRALPDAYVTAHLLILLLGEKSVDELVEISKWPALLKKLNFGKHKGVTFEDAPTDYLEWIRDKSDLDPDVKFSARYWLQKKGNKP